MAKIRVHEFAKKLNIKSADVLSVLKSTEYEVTNVQSAIGEDAQAYVRAHIDQVKPGSDTEQKPQGKPKSDSNGIIGVSKAQQAARPRNIISISGARKPKPERTVEEKAEGNAENNSEAEAGSSRRDRDRNRRRRRGDGSNASNPQESGNTNGSGSETGRKKSGISTLYNAEYSTSTRRNNRDNRNGRRDNNSRPEQHSIIRPRPVGERALRPISERTANREEKMEEKTAAQVTSVQEPASREEQVNQAPKAPEAMQAGGNGADAAENRSAAQAQNAQAGNTSGTMQSPAGRASDSSAQENPSNAASAKDTASKSDAAMKADAATAAKAGAADTQKNTSSAQADATGNASTAQTDAAKNASSADAAAKADTAKEAAAQPGEQILQSGSRILGNIFADGNYTVQDTNDKSSGRSRSRRNRGDRDKRGENRDNNGRGENRDGRNDNRDGNRSGRNDNRDGSRGDGRGSRDGSRGDGQGSRDGRNGNRGDRNAQNGERRNGGQGGDYRNDRGAQNGDRRNDRRGDRSAQNGVRRNGGQGGDYRNDRSAQGGDYRNDRSVQGDRRNDRRGDRNAQSDRRGGGQGGDYRNNAQGGDYRNDRGAQGGDRRGGRAGGRDRFDRDAYDKSAGAEEQVRGKESRERAAVDRKNSNRHQNNNNHDKLGSKRQENYVNLERHGGRKKPQAAPQPAAKEAEDTIRTITIPEKITIRDLADAMKLQPSVIIKELFLKGQMVTVNSEVTFEEAEEIALEHNVICEQEEKVDVIAEYYKEEEEPEESLVTRPPVVCVMGHVDHGKTSLLDAIRSTRVTDREAGGITQHIGASVVSINGQNITFLDTPGHEAFTAMRMRGANSTDIAILVIAADDGVMPQTVEAINHAKAANVEIMVAINKIDKEGANPERVKQELTEYELVPEEWGGSTVFCEVSAKTGEGIANLLEMVLLTAEVLELKANPNRKARGLVIEAQLDKGRGSVATMLVQKGTLHVGDTIVCGSAYGRIRAMMDDQGRRVKEAGPSMPVEILGLNSVPNAGEMFMVPEEEHMAKEIALAYIAEEKNRLIAETRARMSLDDLFSQIQSGNMKELDLIVKADVQGSVEAVKQSLEKLSNDEVVVKVIHGAVGAINESDVILASASNAIIIGFNVKPDPMAKQTAEREKVDVRLYSVIYNAIDDVEAAMKGMLDPIFEERVLGHAEIRMIFKASNVGNIAGSYVLDGTIERGCLVRVSREGKQIFEGELESLKRFKDDVKEVRAGYECGLVIHGFNDIQELDIVEAYKMVEVPR